MSIIFHHIIHYHLAMNPSWFNSYISQFQAITNLLVVWIFIFWKCIDIFLDSKIYTIDLFRSDFLLSLTVRTISLPTLLCLRYFLIILGPLNTYIFFGSLTHVEELIDIFIIDISYFIFEDF
jgi:hypothetical protein